MKIAILGDWRERDLDTWGMKSTKSEFQQACYSLGAKIVEIGCSVIVAAEASDTADPHIVQGIANSPKVLDLQTPAIYIHCPIHDSPFQNLSKSYPNLFSFYRKTQLDWQATHLVTIQEADIVLIIGGGSIAYGAGMATILSKTELIPIGSFGGAGEKLLDKLEEQDTIQDIEIFRILHSPWSAFVLETTLKLIQLEENGFMILGIGKKPCRLRTARQYYTKSTF